MSNRIKRGTGSINIGCGGIGAVTEAMTKCEPSTSEVLVEVGGCVVNGVMTISCTPDNQPVGTLTIDGEPAPDGARVVERPEMVWVAGGCINVQLPEPDPNPAPTEVVPAPAAIAATAEDCEGNDVPRTVHMTVEAVLAKGTVVHTQPCEPAGLRFEPEFLCDENGDRVVSVVALDPVTGVPTETIYNLDQSPWTGDRATLTRCPGTELDIEQTDGCGDGVAMTRVRAFDRLNPAAAPIQTYLDAAGAVIAAPAEFNGGPCVTATQTVTERSAYVCAAGETLLQVARTIWEDGAEVSTSFEYFREENPALTPASFTYGVCQATAPEQSNVHPVMLCATFMGTTSQFIRHYVYNGNSVVQAIDTELDGVIPFATRGTIGRCDAEYFKSERCLVADSDNPAGGLHPAGSLWQAGDRLTVIEAFSVSSPGTVAATRVINEAGGNVVYAATAGGQVSGVQPDLSTMTSCAGGEVTTTAVEIDQYESGPIPVCVSSPTVEPEPSKQWYTFDRVQFDNATGLELSRVTVWRLGEIEQLTPPLGDRTPGICATPECECFKSKQDVVLAAEFSEVDPAPPAGFADPLTVPMTGPMPGLYATITPVGGAEWAMAVGGGGVWGFTACGRPGGTQGIDVAFNLPSACEGLHKVLTTRVYMYDLDANESATLNVPVDRVSDNVIIHDGGLRVQGGGATNEIGWVEWDGLVDDVQFRRGSDGGSLCLIVTGIEIKAEASVIYRGCPDANGVYHFTSLTGEPLNDPELVSRLRPCAETTCSETGEGGTGAVEVTTDNAPLSRIQYTAPFTLPAGLMSVTIENVSADLPAGPGMGTVMSTPLYAGRSVTFTGYFDHETNTMRRLPEIDFVASPSVPFVVTTQE